MPDRTGVKRAVKGIRTIRRYRGRAWLALLLVALGLAGLAAAAGHGYYHGGIVDIKPRFDQPWQRIRYHDTFHDGHSHDGYGHGYHDSNATHIHDEAGDAVARNPWIVVGPQGVLSVARPGPGVPPFVNVWGPLLVPVGPNASPVVEYMGVALPPEIDAEFEEWPNMSSVGVVSRVSADDEVDLDSLNEE